MRCMSHHYIHKWLHQVTLINLQDNLGSIRVIQTEFRQLCRENDNGAATSNGENNSKAQTSICSNLGLEFERSRNSPISKSALWASPAGAVAKVRRASALLYELKEFLSFSSVLGLCLLFSVLGEDEVPLEFDPPDELVRDLSQLITVVPRCSRNAGKVRRQQQMKPKLSSRKLSRCVSILYVYSLIFPFYLSLVKQSQMTYE